MRNFVLLLILCSPSCAHKAKPTVQPVSQASVENPPLPQLKHHQTSLASVDDVLIEASRIRVMALDYAVDPAIESDSVKHITLLLQVMNEAVSKMLHSKHVEAESDLNAARHAIAMLRDYLRSLP